MARSKWSQKFGESFKRAWTFQNPYWSHATFQGTY